MPRAGQPRGGEGPSRRAPLPHGLGATAHGPSRRPTPLRLVPPDRVPGALRRVPRPMRPPRALPLTDAAAVADALAARTPATAAPAIPLGGPSAEERARRLRAAYEASARDAGQRQLLREIMDHFRAWCEAHALGDPFRRG